MNTALRAALSAVITAMEQSAQQHGDFCDWTDDEHEAVANARAALAASGEAEYARLTPWRVSWSFDGTDVTVTAPSAYVRPRQDWLNELRASLERDDAGKPWSVVRDDAARSVFLRRKL